MRLAILLLSCFIVFAAPAQANMDPKDIKKFMDLTEETLNLGQTIEQIKMGEIDTRKLQIIYLILQNNFEIYVHNLNGAEGNEVFLFKDGHREAVYDPKGNLVKDGVNDGSYNYYDLRKEPLRHFSFDTHPWIIWGVSREETTSQEERISGLVKDIGSAIIAALQKRDNLGDIKKDGWDRLGQLQAVAIIYVALEKVNSNTLYALFDKEMSKITRSDIIKSIMSLESGLNKLYQSNEWE